MRNRVSHPFPEPSSFPRRVLLCLTGMSPQIVTETLYSLAILQSPPWIPTEVHLLTTTEGARIALETLFDATHGKFWQLIKDYGLPEIPFSQDFIYTLQDRWGHPLSDIRSDEDNERAANFIEDIVRKLTLDPESSLHLSMAGGRKTMGFYAGYALSLFGRPQDRLSHVLVSHPFESLPSFFYPSPEPTLIPAEGDEGVYYSTRDARIMLAAVPFVLLRHILPDTFLATHKSFEEIVKAAQSSIPAHRLQFDLSHQHVIVGDEVVVLPPSELAFWSWFARRKKMGKGPISCPKDLVPNPEYAQEFFAELRLIRGEMGGIERTQKALKKGMDQDFFEQKRSRLNHKLMTILRHHADPYLIRGRGTRGKKYELGLRGEFISFVTPNIEETKKGIFVSSPRSSLEYEGR